MTKHVEVDIRHHKSVHLHPEKSVIKCARCSGTGKVHNPNSIFDMTCPTCGGKGWNSAPA